MSDRTIESQSEALPPAGGLTMAHYFTLFAIAAVLTAVAEMIGPFSFGLVSLYPLIWGILLGGLVSLQQIRPFPLYMQSIAVSALQIGVLFLVARLSVVVGANVMIVAKVGPAIILQEIGNLFTVIFGVPLAIMLGMGRASIGACFSIGREPSIAITGERYGVESDERRGAMAIYIFGTVFGALLLSLLASLLAATGWFDPLALAMASGVGSGSMMAAATAAIAEYFPGSKDEILALAATSNLLSAMLGIFVGMYVALPLSEFVYRLFAGRADAGTTEDRAPAVSADLPATATPHASPVWVLMAVMIATMFVAVWLSRGEFSLSYLPGLAAVLALTLAGVLVTRLTGISTIVSVMAVGMVIGLPWSPLSGTVNELMKPIDFLPLTTPVLVMAGLGLGEDARMLRHIGWRIFPVGIVIFAATFLASAVIAQLVLGGA